MAKGSKIWADSYIALSNGETIYVENSVTYIKRKMNSDTETIVFDIAAWIREETITVRKKDIVYYGEIWFNYTILLHNINKRWQ